MSTPERLVLFSVGAACDFDGDAVYARLYADGRDEGAPMSWTHRTREGAMARALDVAQRVADDFPTWCTTERKTFPDGLEAWLRENPQLGTADTEYRPADIRVEATEQGARLVWEVVVRCVCVRHSTASVVVDGETYTRPVAEKVFSPWFRLTRPVCGSWGKEAGVENVTVESHVRVSEQVIKVWP